MLVYMFDRNKTKQQLWVVPKKKERKMQPNLVRLTSVEIPLNYFWSHIIERERERTVTWIWKERANIELLRDEEDCNSCGDCDNLLSSQVAGQTSARAPMEMLGFIETICLACFLSLKHTFFYIPQMKSSDHIFTCIHTPLSSISIIKPIITSISFSRK
jgi:hypothetical protein